MTDDEIERKMVSWIEPMPTEPSIYYTASPMGMWVYVCRQWQPA